MTGLSTVSTPLPPHGLGRFLPAVAWGAWLLSVGVLVTAIVLWASQRFAPPPVRFLDSAATIVGQLVFGFACVTVGLLLGTKRSSNLLGWTFMGLGAMLIGTVLVNFLIAEGHEVLRPMPYPIVLGAWLINAFSVPVCVLMAVLVFLTFPDGHCLTRRWTWIAVAASISAAVLVVASGLNPRGLFWYPSLPNPFAVPVAYDGALLAVAVVGLAGLLATLALATWSMFVRYRLSDTERRIQLKWIASAGVVLAVSGTPFLVLRYGLDMPDAVGSVAFGLLMLAATLFPVATAVAILRYHALDIDLLINRAVVYLAMSGILGGLYTATILLFQRIFIAVTGDRSDGAIVLATLVLATLFTPVRKWAEGIADKYLKPDHDAPGHVPPGYSADPARPGVAGWDFNRGEPIAAPLAASLGAAAADETDGPSQPAADDAARISQLEARLRMLEEQLRRGA